MTNTEEFLAHYGVLGMHWGRRSGSSNVSTPKLSRTDRNIEKYKKLIISKNGNIDEAKKVAGLKSAGALVAKLSAYRLAQIGIKNAVRGVSYYNPKTMRGIAFQMNPIVANYLHSAAAVGMMKSSYALVKDSYNFDTAVSSYKADQRKIAKTKLNGVVNG